MKVLWSLGCSDIMQLTTLPGHDCGPEVCHRWHSTWGDSSAHRVRQKTLVGKEGENGLPSQWQRSLCQHAPQMRISFPANTKEVWQCAFKSCGGSAAWGGVYIGVTPIPEWYKFGHPPLGTQR